MPKLQMIASDLDGTLLNADHQVSEINIQAIKHAIEIGLIFVIATGRPPRWIRPIPGICSIGAYVIASNGALTLDPTGKTLAIHSIDPQVIADVQTELRSELPVGLAIDKAESWVPDEIFLDQFVSNKIHKLSAEEPRSDLAMPDILKLLVGCQTLPIHELHDAVTAIIGDRLTCTFSSVDSKALLELSAPGVTKASGLVNLLDQFGYHSNELAAFGDMPNDLGMLHLAGYPFIPANAHPSLIAEGFPMIGNHNDDAVGHKIEALLTNTLD